MRGSALVTTLDSADCDCCETCEGCCGDTIPQFATVTITTVTGTSGGCACSDWNTTFELELVHGASGICYWELTGGPCGPDPALRLTYAQTPCDNSTRMWRLMVYHDVNDQVTEPWAEYIHHSTESLADCEDYWAAMSAGFTMFLASSASCPGGSWSPGGGSPVSVTLHD